MSRSKIRYDPGSQDLVVDGYGRLLTEGSGVFTSPAAVLEDLTLTEVRHALQHWVDDNGRDEPEILISDDSPEYFGEHSAIGATELVLKAGKLLIHTRVFFESEPVIGAGLLAPLGPLLRRRRAEITQVNVEAVQGYWMVTLSIDWRRPGAHVQQALKLADDARALCDPCVGGEITRSVATDLVRAGRAELLIGMHESEWLEVKSGAYRLHEPSQEIELAKDVAAMANASGGIIVLGVKAKKLPEYEEIRVINGCRLADVSPRRYRQLIRQRVFPEVRGFTVEPIPGPSADEGLVLLTIPEQDAGTKPFLVHGAVVGEKVLGAFVGIPYRRGDDTFFIDPQTLHARLRAGEQALGAGKDPRIEEMQGQLQEARDTSVPTWLRRVVAAARNDGITVEHGRGSVAFRGPHGTTVVVSSQEQGPLADELQRQRLVEQLAALGLRTRLGPRGQLIPEFNG